MADVAMIGAGRMGQAMARRLVTAGERVVVWNRTSAVAEDLVAELGGAGEVAPTAADALAAAPIALAVLADGEVTEAVLTSAAALTALTSDTVVVDMGTSGTATARRLGRAITDAGAAFVDAPVSGSVATVDAGQLLVMASGPDGAIDVVESVLGAFSKRVVRLGATGNGQAMKLAVNLVVHGLNAIVSESLALAENAGVARDDAYDVLQESVVSSPYLDYKRGVLTGHDDAVAFTLGLVAKDLGLIQELADDLGVPIEVTEAAARSVQDALEQGYSSRDMGQLRAAIAERVGGRAGTGGA